jgi:hypothetical protein
MSRTHGANDPHGSRGVHTSLGLQIVAWVLCWAVLSMAWPDSLHASVGVVRLDHHINWDWSSGGLKVVHWDNPDVSEGKDSLDWVLNPSSFPPWPGAGDIGLWSEVDGFKLYCDFRPVDSTSSITFYVALIWIKQGQATFDHAENSLSIDWYRPDDTFAGEDVYITVNGQTYDAKTTSTIDLPPMTGTYRSGEVYLTGTISFEPISVPPPSTAQAPKTDTGAASNITATTAELSGRLLDDGGEDCQYRFSYWRDGGSVQRTSWSGWVKGGQDFSTLLSNLEPGCRYSFCAEAKNSGGASEGPTTGFVTETASAQPPAPPVITPPVNPNKPPTEIRHQNPDSDWGKRNPGGWNKFPEDMQNVCFVQYWVSGFAESTTNYINRWRMGTFALFHKEGSSDTLDYAGGNDGIIRVTIADGKNIYGFEKIPNPQSLLLSAVTGYPPSTSSYGLCYDGRSPNSTADVNLEAGLDNFYDSTITFAKDSDEMLLFSFPVNTKDNFIDENGKERPISVWTYTGDENKVNIGWRTPPKDLYTESPITDVRHVIKNLNGVYWLGTMPAGTYIRGTTCKLKMSTSRLFGDIVRDGQVNHEDYNLAVACWGFQGSVADVAGKEEILGRPDGRVDVHDLTAIYSAMSPEEKVKVVLPEAAVEPAIP